MGKKRRAKLLSKGGFFKDIRSPIPLVQKGYKTSWRFSSTIAKTTKQKKRKDAPFGLVFSHALPGKGGVIYTPKRFKGDD